MKKSILILLAATFVALCFGIDQGPCPNEGVVGNSIGSASFSQEGRLCYLWYPYPACYELVEYHTSDTNEPYLGAYKKLGSFAGLRIDGIFSWLMERPIWSQSLSYTSDNSGVLQIIYTKSGTEVTETAFMCVDRNVLVRHFEVKNTGIISHSYKFNYYSLFNMNKNYQTFLLWEGTDCYLTHDSGIFVWYGPEDSDTLAVAVGDDGTKPLLKTGMGIKDAWWDPDAYVLCESEQENIYDYHALSPNGYKEWDLGIILPNSSAEITIFIAMGIGRDDAKDVYLAAKNTGYNNLLNTTNNYWSTWIAQAYIPQGITPIQLQTYKRALITLKMNADVNSGAITAAPTVQPQYYSVWPRDGTYNAVALAMAGYYNEAKKFFDTWLPSVQESDGHWMQCYVMDRAYAGLLDLENDQIPTVMWGVHTVWQLSGDTNWVMGSWPMLRSAADYLVQNCIDGLNYNLLTMTCDWAEDPTTDIRTSVYTNSAAVCGLKSAADIAELASDTLRALLYREKAFLIKEGLLTHLWDPSVNAFYTADGYTGLYHRLTGGAGDLMVIVWPFNVLPATDPKAIGSANYIESYFDSTTDNIWLPMRFFMATYWKSYGDDAKALSHINYALNHLTQVGWIAEGVSYSGAHLYANPLSWSQAGYVMALLYYYGGTGILSSNTRDVPGFFFECVPNPFSQETEIRYTIQDAGYKNVGQGFSLAGSKVQELKIYDATGKLIRQWNNGSALGGIKLSDHIIWDGKDNSGNNLPAGTYFLLLKTKDKIFTKKVLLVR